MKINLEAFSTAIVLWLSSRLVIAISMLLLAPALPAPSNGITPQAGWEVFAYWDSGWYQGIATTGYEFAPDGQQHNVAFFPLFPLLIRALMLLGLPFPVAGTIVSNASFLGALVLLYGWMQQRHGQAAARWATAALAWCPLSLFGTVIYTEGLFLLCSTAALSAFEHGKYWQATLWGMLTTATRLPGIVIVPTFLWVAWREKRGKVAYVTALAASGGLLLYMLYCGLKFGEPLAFAVAHKAWRPPEDFYGQGWLKMLVQITAGPVNWKHGSLVDPWHPLFFGLICLLGIAVWRSRDKLGAARTDYGLFILILLLWLLAGSPFVNTSLVFGGGYLLWHFRHQLHSIATTYGYLNLGLVLAMGLAASAERYAFGNVSLSMTWGLLFRRYPRWGFITTGFFAVLLASLSIRFAQHLWAG